MAEYMEIRAEAPKTLKQLYELLAANRRPYLDRARECARLTIPALLSQIGDTSMQELSNRFNSVGAESINGLANKIMLALFPPGSVFFRLRVIPAAEKAFNKAREQSGPEGADQVDELRSRLDNRLAEVEAEIIKAFEATSPRGELFQTIRQLIVTGSAVVWSPDDKLTCVPLTNYVAQRAGDRYKRIILKTMVALEQIPRAYRMAAMACCAADQNNQDGDGPKETLPLDCKDAKSELAVYTCQLLMENNRYMVWQELPNGVRLGSESYYKQDEQPIMALTYSLLPREHYGRGLVEDFLGDFNAIEALSKATVAAAAVMSRVVGLVNPGGMTDAKEVMETPNGGFCTGRADDVQFVQVQKTADISGASQILEKIISRVRAAFLSSFAVRREGDRVTAEEIRLIASELESTLGGVYSMLAHTLQYPLIRRTFARLSKSGQFSDVAQVSEPVIITGLEALGRTAEVSRLQMFAQAIGTMYGPNEFARISKSSAVAKLLAGALGISTLNIIKSDAQVAQEAQQARQAQMQQEAMLAAVKGGAGPAAKAAVEQNPEAIQGAMNQDG